MLDGSIPLHGNAFWAFFFVGLGLVLLVGSVVLLLSTNIGFKKAFAVSALTFLGYLFLHSLTWVLSGNGPLTSATATSYIDRRIVGMAIGAGTLVIMVIWLAVWHVEERNARNVPD